MTQVPPITTSCFSLNPKGLGIRLHLPWIPSCPANTCSSRETALTCYSTQGRRGRCLTRKRRKSKRTGKQDNDGYLQTRIYFYIFERHVVLSIHSTTTFKYLSIYSVPSSLYKHGAHKTGKILPAHKALHKTHTRCVT